MAKLSITLGVRMWWERYRILSRKHNTRLPSPSLICYAVSINCTSFDISWHCGCMLCTISIFSSACYCLIFKMVCVSPILLRGKVFWLLMLGPCLNGKPISFPTTIIPQCLWPRPISFFLWTYQIPFRSPKPLHVVFHLSRMLLFDIIRFWLLIHPIYN